MAWATSATGSQTCTISTEHDLQSTTTAGCYIVSLDLNALTGGTTPDILELRIYGKARSSDTERLIALHSFVGAQSCPLFLSAPVVTPHHLRASIKQTQGTGRAVPWATYFL